MRKLEELFGLPPLEVLGQRGEDAQPESTAEAETKVADTKLALAAVDEAMDKIDIALPTVRDLDASDKEMDDLAALAQSTFTDLIDLSMNVEPRYSGPIIQSAAVLLGHAITAKMAKMDKKLKMVDLQLKKAKLDQVELNKNPVDKAIEGKGVTVDRNELLRQILAQTPKVDK